MPNFKIKTRVTELLGIEYPIIQGAMAWIADSSLASAVSNAGGLGIIACGAAEPEYVRKEIERCRELTDKPFGINIMLLSEYVDDLMDLVIEEKIPIITTGAGNPGKYIKRLKEHNVKVIPVVASVAVALRVARAGADAIIAEGLEAGGHIGEITTMALVPQVVDAVDIPVIAAGGIADGRGMAAAFMLGAEGVQVGTRFLVAEECTVSRPYKDVILNAKDSSTVVSGRNTGHPIRVIHNELTREITRLEKKNADQSEIDAICTGALKKAVKDGDMKRGSIMSGQIAGLVKKEQPAAEIIADLMNDCERVFKRGNVLVKGGGK